MERLRLILGGLVAVLALVLVAGLVFGGGEDQPTSGAATVAEQAAVPAPAARSHPTPDSDGAPGPPPSERDRADPARSGGGDRSGPGPDAEQSKGGEPGRSEGVGDDASTGTAPSKAAFIERVDKICAAVPRRFAARAEAVQEEAGPAPGSEAEQEELFRRAAAPVLAEMASAIAALTPPSGSEERVEAIVSAAKRGARRVEEAPVSTLSGGTSPLAEFGRLAGRFGMKRCSEF